MSDKNPSKSPGSLYDPSTSKSSFNQDTRATQNEKHGTSKTTDTSPRSKVSASEKNESNPPSRFPIGAQGIGSEHHAKPAVRFPLLQEAIKKQEEAENSGKQAPPQFFPKNSKCKSLLNSRERLFKRIKILKKNSETIKAPVCGPTASKRPFFPSPFPRNLNSSFESANSQNQSNASAIASASSKARFSKSSDAILQNTFEGVEKLTEASMEQNQIPDPSISDDVLIIDELQNSSDTINISLDRSKEQENKPIAIPESSNNLKGQSSTLKSSYISFSIESLINSSRPDSPKPLTLCSTPISSIQKNTQKSPQKAVQVSSQQLTQESDQKCNPKPVQESMCEATDEPSRACTPQHIEDFIKELENELGLTISQEQNRESVIKERRKEIPHVSEVSSINSNLAESLPTSSHADPSMKPEEHEKPNEPVLEVNAATQPKAENSSKRYSGSSFTIDNLIFSKSEPEQGRGSESEPNLELFLDPELYTRPKKIKAETWNPTLNCVWNPNHPYPQLTTSTPLDQRALRRPELTNNRKSVINSHNLNGQEPGCSCYNENINNSNKENSIAISNDFDESTIKISFREPMLPQNEKMNYLTPKRPKYVVRPAPLDDDLSESEDSDIMGVGYKGDNKNKARRKYIQKLNKKITEHPFLNRQVVLPIFSYLSQTDLYKCMFVCKKWNQLAIDPNLWKSINLSNKKIDKHMINGVVRRQPLSLNLSWATITRNQLKWLIARSPQLKALQVRGILPNIVTVLGVVYWYSLKRLDLSFIHAFNDSHYNAVFRCSDNVRPGWLENNDNRFRFLTHLSLAGSEITGVTIDCMISSLPELSFLDVSLCVQLLEQDIVRLITAKYDKLVSLNVSLCPNMSDYILVPLSYCHNLIHLDTRECKLISMTALEMFMRNSTFKHELLMLKPKFLLARSAIKSTIRISSDTILIRTDFLILPLQIDHVQCTI